MGLNLRANDRLAYFIRGLFIVTFVVGAFAVSARPAAAHNVVASGAYDCEGGWTYSASYENGGGDGGAAHNRLVVIDVTIGANTIKEYHYFDTLTSHPPAPAGFTVIDHPITSTFQLFDLSGVTGPISATGSIKVYSAGSSLSPSTDAAYPHYLAGDSEDPIPGLAAALQCPSPTKTASPTATATVTSTATATQTWTPTSTQTATVTPSSTPVPPTATTTNTPAAPTETSTPENPTATPEPLTPTPGPSTGAVLGSTSNTSVPDTTLTTATATPGSEALGVVVGPEPPAGVELPRTGDGSSRNDLWQLGALALMTAGAAGLTYFGVTGRRAP